jgi:hypothetical protein
MAYRDCVLKGGRTLSTFAFASVKAISQYTVEEILEMGIDGVWIGYEGTRSGYAKQQGRPIEDILAEFREHGITALTSMILGFDYQNEDVIAEELDGLMKLKPALAQFLIYGPVPGTPFHKRALKDNLLHDAYAKDTDLFCRVGDGFTTMCKHPTLSPGQIENMQRWCFKEDFERLGPSILRIQETRLLGYQKLKGSPNPVLRRKAERYARDLREAYPVYLAGRLFGPNARIRRWTGDLERRLHAELGAPTLAERLKSLLAVGGALWTALTLKFDWFQHPRLGRTTYRLPGKSWSSFDLWEDIPRKIAIPELSIQVDLQHAKKQVWLRLEGVLAAPDAEGLAQRIQDSLARSKSRLILDLNNLRWDTADDLRPLLERLARYRSNIRLVMPKLTAAHPELLLLFAMFHHYKG